LCLRKPIAECCSPSLTAGSHTPPLACDCMAASYNRRRPPNIQRRHLPLLLVVTLLKLATSIAQPTRQGLQVHEIAAFPSTTPPARGAIGRCVYLIAPSAGAGRRRKKTEPSPGVPLLSTQIVPFMDSANTPQR